MNYRLLRSLVPYQGHLMQLPPEFTVRMTRSALARSFFWLQMRAISIAVETSTRSVVSASEAEIIEFYSPVLRFHQRYLRAMPEFDHARWIRETLFHARHNLLLKQAIARVQWAIEFDVSHVKLKNSFSVEPKCILVHIFILRPRKAN